MSVAQGTKTFDEWLNDEGKRFKYLGEKEQNRAYWTYVDSQAKAGGLDEYEHDELIDMMTAKNS